MIYRNFKDLNLPVITFGGAALSGEGGGYGFGDLGEKEAEKLILAAVDQGVTLFDTAPIYGFGLSEERLGRYLPKSSMVITKSGVDWHPTKRVNMTNHPENTERMLHESLKRLNRDCIDIYMVHWPDKKVDIRLTMEVLVKAQQAGKVRYLGLCNTHPDDFKKASEVGEISFLQSEFNIFNQEAFSGLPISSPDVFTMGWGTFDKGILSGRVTADRKFDASDARSWAPWWNKKEVLQKIERTAKLKSILDEYQIDLPTFVVHFGVSFASLGTCLIGMKTVNDLVKVMSNLREILMRERIEEIMERWNTRS